MPNEPEPQYLHREDFLLQSGCLDYEGLLHGLVISIQSQFPDLFLNPPVELTATLDYPAELAKISRDLGERYAPTLTIDAAGVAQTIDYGDRSKIVVNAGILDWAFDDRLPLLIHTLHHELAHAFEHAVRRGNPKFLQPEGYFYKLVEAIWSEYHAERCSADSFTGESPQAYILCERLVSLREKQSYIDRELLQGLEPGVYGGKAFGCVWGILEMLRYVLGTIAGTGRKPGEIHKGLEQALEQGPSRDFWRTLLVKLDQLYQSFKAQRQLDGIASLTSLIPHIFCAFGYAVRETSDGGLQIRPFHQRN